MVMPIIIPFYDGKSQENHGGLWEFCQRKEKKFPLGSHFMTCLIGELCLWGHFFDLFDPVLWVRDHLAGIHYLDYIF